MSRSSVVDAVILIGIMVMLVGGWQYAAVDGAHTTHITNESTTVSTNSTYTLQADGVRYSNPDVTINGTQAQRGDEYQFYNWSGELYWTGNADPQDGENATISYDVKQQDDTTSGLTGLMSPLQALMGALLFLVVGGTVLATVKNTWGT